MTCARCAELEAQVRTLRSMHCIEDLRVAKLMQWWAVGETTARIALRMFSTRNPVAVPILALTLPKARTGNAVKAQVSMLRRAMDSEAVDTLEGAYQLTEIGRAEIERALAS